MSISFKLYELLNQLVTATEDAIDLTTPIAVDRSGRFLAPATNTAALSYLDEPEEMTVAEYIDLFEDKHGFGAVPRFVAAGEGVAEVE